MPRKPKPTRLRDQRAVRPPRRARVPNEMYTAASGALLAQNAILAAAAVDYELQDAVEGNPLRKRYSRVRDLLMKRHGCSRTSAERAIAEGKVLRMERWIDKELPNKRAELSLQLQRIADAHEDEEPSAAVAALREIGRLNGLYAPSQLKVTHGAELPLQLDAILAILDEKGHAALAVIQEQIERAKAEGRLALPAAGATSGGDVTDAEIVEPDGAN